MSDKVLRAGNVNIAIQGANIPGANGDIDVNATGPQRRSRFAERGFFDFIGDAIDSRSYLPCHYQKFSSYVQKSRT